MAFSRPTLLTLVSRTQADIRSRLGIGGPLLRRAMADVVGACVGGEAHMLYGYLDWATRQLFADTSDREFLLREAAQYGITPLVAAFASGLVTATGIDGAVIPEDTVLVRGDGLTFEVTEDATIADGVAIVEVKAVTAGKASNTLAGETLSFESPVTDVDAEATVGIDGVGGGAEKEDTEGTRARLLLRKREPPQGGADQDYEAWALAVASVTRAWVYPNENGMGTVVVRFVQDGEEDIIPDAGVVAKVQVKLDAERPITAEVTAVAPTELDVDFELAITPDTVELRAAVEAELADLLFREGAPGDGLGRGKILLSHVRTAIGTVAGVDDFTLTTPSADVVPSVGALPVMGTVTWP